MKDVNVILVNWKTKDDIDECLETLFFDIKDSNLDICVQIIDNSGNVDNIKEMLVTKYPQVKYTDPCGNIGFGKANNIAIKNVLAKYHFILNPDTKFIKGAKTLKVLFDYMEENIQVGIVAPKLLNFDNTLQYSCFRFPKFLDKPIRHFEIHKKFNYFVKRINYFLMTDYNHEIERPVDWVMGSAMFVRQKAIDDVGLFDDRFFMYFEDCDWCRRMWDYYWQVRYLPSCVLYHKHKRDSAKIPGIKAVLQNPITRIHIKSWLQYWWKWKFKSRVYYKSE